jgi:hypothetical protein
MLLDHGSPEGNAGNGYSNSNSMIRQSYFTPISWLKKWDDETEGLVSFIYKKDEKLPQILIYQLWLRDYEVKGTRK